MKLTILDGNAVNPGDLSWDIFKKYADVIVYEQTAPESVIERIADSDAVLLNKISINQNILAHCKNLKYIGVMATGYNVIDVEAVKKAGITVCNIPAYSTMAVAQHTFALIQHFSNHVALHNESVHNGDWTKANMFCYWKKPLFELNGKTLGILGYGNIGKQVEKIANAFGMRVIVCPHHPKGLPNEVTKEELFKQAEILTLHAPLNKETEKIVNKETLSLMRKGSYIINTARGALVDEAAIRESLESGQLAGYGADVLTEEPMKESCPLLNAPNCVLTPHLAWAPLETRQRCLTIGFENFEGWIKGKIQNSIY
ncbi:MAG: D-2-hydroxyacid dehydrogenase [Treponema sp.]|nr:D-2-hydroxyacid dehydrogenase [Treponema sp.]